MRGLVFCVVAVVLLAGLGRCARYDSDGCRHGVPGDREGPALAVAMDQGTYKTLRFKSMSFYLPNAAKGTLLTSNNPDVVEISNQPPQHVPGQYEKWLKFGWAVHAGTAVLRMTADDTGEVYRLRVRVSC